MKDVVSYDTKRFFIANHNASGAITTTLFKFAVIQQATF
jgi:hypothetical protein